MVPLELPSTEKQPQHADVLAAKPRATGKVESMDKDIDLDEELMEELALHQALEEEFALMLELQQMQEQHSLLNRSIPALSNLAPSDCAWPAGCGVFLKHLDGDQLCCSQKTPFTWSKT